MDVLIAINIRFRDIRHRKYFYITFDFYILQANVCAFFFSSRLNIIIFFFRNTPKSKELTSNIERLTMGEGEARIRHQSHCKATLRWSYGVKKSTQKQCMNKKALGAKVYTERYKYKVLANK